MSKGNENVDMASVDTDGEPVGLANDQNPDVKISAAPADGGPGHRKETIRSYVDAWVQSEQGQAQAQKLLETGRDSLDDIMRRFMRAENKLLQAQAPFAEIFEEDLLANYYILDYKIGRNNDFIL